MLKESFEKKIDSLNVKIENVEGQLEQIISTIQKVSTIFVFLFGILIALSIGNFLSLLEINETVLEVAENIKETNRSFKNLLELSKNSLGNENTNISWLRAGLICIASAVPFRGVVELIANNNSTSHFLMDTLGDTGSITRALASLLGICQGIFYRISKKETSDNSIFGAIYDPTEFNS